jgi:hypothetical protein
MDIGTEHRPAPSLLINKGLNSNHRVACMIGTKSNRAAISMRVTIHADAVIRFNEVRSRPSCLSGDLPVFGLGAADKMETVEVFWPNGQTSAA